MAEKKSRFLPTKKPRPVPGDDAADDCPLPPAAVEYAKAYLKDPLCNEKYAHRCQEFYSAGLMLRLRIRQLLVAYGDVISGIKPAPVAKARFAFVKELGTLDPILEKVKSVHPNNPTIADGLKALAGKLSFTRDATLANIKPLGDALDTLLLDSLRHFLSILEAHGVL